MYNLDIISNRDIISSLIKKRKLKIKEKKDDIPPCVGSGMGLFGFGKFYIKMFGWELKKVYKIMGHRYGVCIFCNKWYNVTGVNIWLKR